MLFGIAGFAARGKVARLVKPSAREGDHVVEGGSWPSAIEAATTGKLQ
jgi:hypothetical protein